VKRRGEPVCLRFALLLSVAAAAFAQSPPSMQPDVAAFIEGMQLTQAVADAAEKTLTGSPEDVVSHCKLISYYFYHDQSGISWEKHLFWLIDHHPESGVFDIPFPITQILRTNSGKPAPPELLREFRQHWEQAAAEHPKDATALLHTATAISTQDLSLGLAYARKAVKADPECTRCRNTLGGFIGSAILRLPTNMQGDWTCLPKTPKVEQTVSELRKEIESSTDPEILLDAGMMIKGHSAVYGSRCGGNVDDAASYGMKLIRKAVVLDPSLVESRHLKDILKSAR
jgi:hypothetical protein